MAFVRWKTNKDGLRYGYLVESYRDETGKVRHRHLGYIGKEGKITETHVQALKAEHQNHKADWRAIPAATHPPQTDVSTLADAELLAKLEILRLERGWSSQVMAKKLNEAGLQTRLSPAGNRYPLSPRQYRHLEERAINGQKELLSYSVDSVQDLCRCLRHLFSAN